MGGEPPPIPRDLYLVFIIPNGRTRHPRKIGQDGSTSVRTRPNFPEARLTAFQRHESVDQGDTTLELAIAGNDRDHLTIKDSADQVRRLVSAAASLKLNANGEEGRTYGGETHSWGIAEEADFGVFLHRLFRRVCDKV